MSFDDYIFVTPGFMRGAARVLDAGGVLSKGDFLFSDSPAEADERALRSDWRVVNRDLNRALESTAANPEGDGER